LKNGILFLPKTSIPLKGKSFSSIRKSFALMREILLLWRDRATLIRDTFAPMRAILPLWRDESALLRDDFSLIRKIFSCGGKREKV
jgi:hypothetical protein